MFSEMCMHIYPKAYGGIVAYIPTLLHIFVQYIK
jgi:hypothetical protein